MQITCLKTLFVSACLVLPMVARLVFSYRFISCFVSEACFLSIDPFIKLLLM
jgi:hypothetical protein